MTEFGVNGPEPSGDGGRSNSMSSPIGDPGQAATPPPKQRPYLTALLLVSVFGFLAAIIIPNFLTPHAQGSLTGCKSNCKNLATAVEMYASDNGGYYPRSLAELLPGKYLKVIPTCPKAGRDTYTDYVAEGTKSFSFSCVGNNHAKAYGGFSTSSNNYPQYNGEQGLLDHP